MMEVVESSLQTSMKDIVNLCRKEEYKEVQIVIRKMEKHLRDEQDIRDMIKIIKISKLYFYDWFTKWGVPNWSIIKKAPFLDMMLFLSYIVYDNDMQSQSTEPNNSGQQVLNDSFNEFQLQSNGLSTDSCQLNGGEELNLELSLPCNSSEHGFSAQSRDSSSISSHSEFQEQCKQLLMTIFGKMSSEIVSALLRVIPPKSVSKISETNQLSTLLSYRDLIDQIRVASSLLSIETYEQALKIYEKLRWSIKYHSSFSYKEQLKIPIQLFVLKCELFSKANNQSSIKNISQISKRVDKYKNIPSWQIAAVFKEIGSQQFKKKKYLEAYHYFTLSLEKQPNQSKVRNHLAIILLELNNPEAAKKIFLPNLSNKDILVVHRAIDLVTYGSILRQMGKHTEAKSFYEESLIIFIQGYRQSQRNGAFLTGDFFFPDNLQNQQNIQLERAQPAFQTVKLIIDKNNGYTKVYFESAVNQYEQYYQKGPNMLSNQESENKLRLIQKKLLYYHQINGNKFFQPLLYLALVNIKQQKYQEGEKNISIVIFQLISKEYKQNLQKVLVHLKEIRKINKFSQNVMNNLMQLIKKMEKKNKLLIKNRWQDGNQFLKIKMYLTAQQAFYSIMSNQILSEAINISQFHSKMLQCCSELRQEGSLFSTKQYFYEKISKQQMVIDKDNYILLIKIFQEIEDEDDAKLFFQKIKFDSDQNQQFIEYGAESLLKRGFEIMEKHQNYDQQKQFKYQKMLIKILHKKQIASLTNENFSFISQICHTKSNDFQLYVMIGDIFTSVQLIKQANEAFKSAFSCSENSQTFDKLEANLIKIDDKEALLELIQKRIEFQNRQLTIENNVSARIRIQGKVYSSWKRIIKLSEELRLQKTRVEKIRMGFQIFLEKTLKLTDKNKLVYKSQLVRDLIQIKKADKNYKEIRDLLKKIVSIHPNFRVYLQWKNFCLNNQECLKIHKQINNGRLCERCEKDIKSINSVKTTSQLFLILERKEEDSLFLFIEWIDSVKKSLKKVEYIKLNAFLNSALQQAEQPTKYHLSLMRNLFLNVFSSFSVKKTTSDDEQTFKILIQSYIVKISTYDIKKQEIILLKLSQIVQDFSYEKKQVFQSLIEDYLSDIKYHPQLVKKDDCMSY